MTQNTQTVLRNPANLENLARYIRTKEEAHYLPAFEALRFVQNSIKESGRLRRLVEILHGPSKGIIPGPSLLSYISPSEGLHIVSTPENQKIPFLQSTDFPYLEFFYQKIIANQPSILRFSDYSFSHIIPLDASVDLFVKWVDPVRVAAIDWEISIAAQLHHTQVNVPTFYGYAANDDNAYLIAKVVEGVDFLRVCYVDDLYSLVVGENNFENPTFIGPFISLLQSSFKQKITFPFLKEKVAEAYYTLGTEVRKAVEAGLRYPDVALRNSMLTYESGKPKITLIDFEQATMTDTITEGMRGATIGTLGTQLASSSLESKQLYKGFWA